MPARTWSQKWKRDNWTQHLFGRILRPSHGQSFLGRWTFFLEDFPVSHSAQQESEQETKTKDTSFPTFWTGLESSDLPLFSLKMLRESSQQNSKEMNGKIQPGLQFCFMSSDNWNEWVTKRRQEYSQRLNWGRPTSAKECSSWGSPAANDANKSRVAGEINSNQAGLARSVGREITNWPTPDTNNHRDGTTLRKDNNLEQGGFHGVSLHHAMTKYGPPAPKNWSTPSTMDTLPPKSPEGIQRVLTHDGRTNRKSTGNLREDVVQFGPPDPDNRSTHGNLPELWATPRAGKTTDENPETWAARQANGDVTTMPLTAQVKAWATPATRDTQGPRGKGAQERKGNPMDTLPNQLETTSMRLNPRWVETLMGLPVGWTMVSCTRPIANPAHAAMMSSAGNAEGTTQTVHVLGQIVSMTDSRTDELRLLGNGVVPACAEKAFVTLFNQLHENTK
jgi:hypothetical protein